MIDLKYFPVSLEGFYISGSLAPRSLLAGLTEFGEGHRLDCPDFLTRRLTIEVNGEIIEPARWIEVDLKDGDVVVISPDIGRQGLGGVIMAVAGIALVVAAPYLAPYLGVTVAGMRTFGTMVAISGTLSAGLSLLTPDPSTPSFGLVGQDLAAGSPTYSAEMQVNPTDPGLPVPIIYGTHKVTPHLINAFLTQDLNIIWNYVFQDDTASSQSAQGWINVFAVTKTGIGIQFRLRNPQPWVGSEGEYTMQAGCAFKIEYAQVGTENWAIWREIFWVPGAYAHYYQDTIQIQELAEQQWKVRVTNVSQAGSQGDTWWSELKVKAKSDIHDAEDTQHLYLLYGICEGEIDGISGIEINDRPIANFAKQPEIWTRPGTNNQDPIPGFREIHNFKSAGGSGIKLTQNTPQIITTDGNNISAVVVHLQSPQFYRQRSDGSIIYNSVDLRIEYRVSPSGEWHSQDFTIQGKSRSTMKRLFRIPGSSYLSPNTYDIRVTRLSPDQTEFTVASDIYLMGIDEIQDVNLSYPGTALLAIRALMTGELSGSLPRVSCIVRGLKIYRLQTQDVAWSNNPFDCLYDLFTNDNYGLGGLIDSSDIDISLWTSEAAYCDVLVDGEKRFCLDIVLDSLNEALDIISQICLNFRGIPIISGDAIQIKIDKPETSTQPFTMGNIIKDSYCERFLSISRLPNVLEIQFCNKDKNYERDFLQVRMSDNEEKEEVKRISLIGTTRPCQAARIGKYLLKSARPLMHQINLGAMIDALRSQPADRIDFAHDAPGLGISGRLASAAQTQTRIVLDRDVTIESGSSYCVFLRLADDVLQTKNVDEATTTGGNYPWTGKIIYMEGTGFTTIPPEKTPYSFGIINAEKKSYRISTISRLPSLDFQVAAYEYDESIYDETGVVVSTPFYSMIPSPMAPPPAVTDLALSEAADQLGIIISFNIPSPRLNFDFAAIQISIDGMHFYTEKNVRDNSPILLTGILSGQQYTIRVVSYNSRGIPCKTPPSAIITLIGPAFRPPAVRNLQLKDQGNEQIFLGNDAQFTWTWSDIQKDIDYFSHFRVQILIDGEVKRKEVTKDKSYNYTLAKNAQDNGKPHPSFTIKVSAISKGMESDTASLSVSNALPPTPVNLTAVGGFRSVVFAWEKSLQPDHRDWLIRTKVGAANWSSWKAIAENSYQRNLTQPEIDSYGISAGIQIEVKERDNFFQSSSTAANASSSAEAIRQIDLTGSAFQIVPTDSDGNPISTLKVLYDAVLSSGGVAYDGSVTEDWIQYEFPVSHIFNQVLIWASASMNCYVAYSENGSTWNYLKGETDHTLDANGKLLEAANQADAQTNYWTTGASGLVKALWPYMRQGRYLRLYIKSAVTLYELKWWTYVIADEIDAGVLHLARGISIASVEDSQNAVIINTNGLRAYSGGVQKVNISPTGITISAGSGYANLSDKPTQLSNINASEGMKLSGIESGADVTGTHQAASIAGQGALATQSSADFATQVSGAQKPENNATVGANWSTNLTNRPTELTDGRVATALHADGYLKSKVLPGSNIGTPGGAGLFLGADCLGYYSGSEWKVFIKSDATFTLKGDANNLVSWDGVTLTIKGAIVIQSGLGYGNLSDKPTQLSQINTSEGTKLSGIEAGADVTSTHTAAAISGQGALATLNAADFATQVSGAQKPENNATVGANWSTNLTNRPTELTDGRVSAGLSSSGYLVSCADPAVPAPVAGGAGLYLGSDYLGYYSGSAWNAYIKSDGTFKFYGAADKYIEWTGAALNIRGALTADDIVAGILTGRHIRTASSGARAEMFPNANTGLVIYDDAAAEVLKVLVGGTDVGDVIIGNYSGGKGLKWDKSAAAFSIGKSSQLLGAEAYVNSNIYFHSFFESLDGWGVSVIGTGSVTHQTTFVRLQGVTTNDAAFMRFHRIGLIRTTSWGSNRKFKTKIRMDAVASQRAYVISGYCTYSNPTPGHFGFYINGSTIYGSCANGSAQSTVDLGTSISGNWQLLEAIFTPGNNVEFFIDGVSKGTLSTNLPSTGVYHQSLMMYQIVADAAVTSYLDTSECIVLQD